MSKNKPIEVEFSTKVDPTTPESEGGGFATRDPHQLYNKILQNGIDLIEKENFSWAYEKYDLLEWNKKLTKAYVYK